LLFLALIPAFQADETVCVGYLAGLRIPCLPAIPTIKIRIPDARGISAGILRKAEKEAGALLESGGIKVIWRDCSKAGGCEHQLAADELIFHLRHHHGRRNRKELSMKS
jgi:hypothetical protein